VVKTPSKEEFKTINAGDKDADRYIVTLGSMEAVNIFNIKRAKEH
jgi:hypothetical protein